MTALRRTFVLATSLAILALPGVWAADPVAEQPATTPESKVSIEPRAKPSPNTVPSPRANIRVESTMVLIPVTVTDPFNRFVTGLEKDSFKLFEDKKEQEILQFSSEDAPLSIGVVFDCSGSMGSKLEKSPSGVANASRGGRMRGPSEP